MAFYSRSAREGGHEARGMKFSWKLCEMLSIEVWCIQSALRCVLPTGQSALWERHMAVAAKNQRERLLIEAYLHLVCLHSPHLQLVAMPALGPHPFHRICVNSTNPIGFGDQVEVGNSLLIRLFAWYQKDPSDAYAPDQDFHSVSH